MELPIDHKDLKTIVNALSLGGDTRLYFLLKNIIDDRNLKLENTELEFSNDPNNVQVFSESDEYQCKSGVCDV
jgi:hypothetical protein|tara:strand:- start:842 stop:1060 length:219 start_codon:yes stop_codon:yes gene_type:complete